MRHCSNCGSTKHTKNHCTSKKKSKRMNYGIIEESESEDSQNETNESDEESESEEEWVNEESEDDEPKHFNAGKKKDGERSLLLHVNNIY